MRATDEDLALLRVRLNRLQQTLDQEGVKLRLEEEQTFHRSIVEFAHFDILLHFYDQLSVIQQTWIIPSMTGVTHTAPAIRTMHPPILEAIEARNPDEAERVARFHLQEALDFYLISYEQKKQGTDK